MTKTIIKGNGFVLRHILMSDAEGYLQCHQDRLAKAAFNSLPCSVAEAKKEVREVISNMKRKPPAEEMFAIESNGQFAGFANLKFSDHPNYRHSAVISYGIHKEFRGVGLATAVVKKLTSYAFNKHRLKRISASCRAFNKASVMVLEKAGYKIEGIQKKQKFKNGKYFDNMLWAKVK